VIANFVMFQTKKGANRTYRALRRLNSERPTGRGDEPVAAFSVRPACSVPLASDQTNGSMSVGPPRPYRLKPLPSKGASSGPPHGHTARAVACPRRSDPFVSPAGSAAG
jgi:hypothetical protein